MQSPELERVNLRVEVPAICWGTKTIQPKGNKLVEKLCHRDAAGKWPQSTHVALISRDLRFSSPADRHQRLFPDTLLPKQEGAPNIQPVWLLIGPDIGQTQPDKPQGRTEMDRE